MLRYIHKHKALSIYIIYMYSRMLYILNNIILSIISVLNLRALYWSL